MLAFWGVFGDTCDIRSFDGQTLPPRQRRTREEWHGHTGNNRIGRGGPEAVG